MRKVAVLSFVLVLLASFAGGVAAKDLPASWPAVQVIGPTKLVGPVVRFLAGKGWPRNLIWVKTNPREWGGDRPERGFVTVKPVTTDRPDTSIEIAVAGGRVASHYALILKGIADKYRPAGARRKARAKRGPVPAQPQPRGQNQEQQGGPWVRVPEQRPVVRSQQPQYVRPQYAYVTRPQLVPVYTPRQNYERRWSYQSRRYQRYHRQNQRRLVRRKTVTHHHRNNAPVFLFPVSMTGYPTYQVFYARNLPGRGQCYFRRGGRIMCNYRPSRGTVKNSIRLVHSARPQG